MKEMCGMNVSELICTRISHDLIGNIGAFANAVELLEDDDDDFLEDIKSTLKNSSDTLNARLKFFRMAFGLESTNLDNITTVKKTTEDYLRTLNPRYPLNLEIKGSGCASLNRAVMLACMIAADVLIRGGNISVFIQEDKVELEAGSATFSEMRIKEMLDILDMVVPENLSLYAPLFYLQEKLGMENKKLGLFFEDTFKIKIL